MSDINLAMIVQNWVSNHTQLRKYVTLWWKLDFITKDYSRADIMSHQSDFWNNKYIATVDLDRVYIGPEYPILTAHDPEFFVKLEKLIKERLHARH